MPVSIDIKTGIDSPIFLSEKGESGVSCCCYFYHFRKSSRIKDGHIGKNLPIELYPGLFQAADKLTVTDVIHVGAGINAGNPQPTEITLFGPPISVGIHKGPINGLCGSTIEAATSTPETFSQFQYFISSSAGLKPSSRAWHFLLLVGSVAGNHIRTTGKTKMFE